MIGPAGHSGLPFQAGNRFQRQQGVRRPGCGAGTGADIQKRGGRVFQKGKRVFQRRGYRAKGSGHPHSGVNKRLAVGGDQAFALSAFFSIAAERAPVLPG